MMWMEEGKSTGLWRMLGGCRGLTREGRWAGKSVVNMEGRNASPPHDSSKPDCSDAAPRNTLHVSFMWGDDVLISWYG